MSEKAIDLLDTAISMEEEGIEFYSGFIQKARDARAQKMFSALANDEMRHKKLFIEIKESLGSGKGFKHRDTWEMRSLPVFPEVKKEFERKKAFEKVSLGHQKVDITVADALHIAASAEKRSIQFYTEMLESEEDLDIIVTLERIIAEEILHFKLVKAQHEFVKSTGFWFDMDEFHEFREVKHDELRDMLEKGLIGR